MGMTEDPRDGSVMVRGKARPAWRTTPSRGGVVYDRGDGTLVVAGPAVERTYASAGSVTDKAREVDTPGAPQ